MDIGSRKVADLVTSRNPFVYKLNVRLEPGADGADPRLILAGAILITAIEGRQGSGGIDVSGG
jgi:hypothetical protein